MEAVAALPLQPSKPGAWIGLGRITRGTAHERARGGPPRGASACRSSELAGRRAHARDVPLHRLRGDALRLLLHGLFLHPGREPPALAAASVPSAGLRRVREHLHPGDVELHDALGAAVDQTRQPRRHASRADADLPDGPDVPAHAAARVRAGRLHPARPGVRDDLLLPDGTPRSARLRRPDDPRGDDDARVSGPLQPRGSPRRRDRGDLLALRGRNVDSRVHDRLHPLNARGAMPLNPFRSEAEAYRFVWLTIGYFGLIVAGALINRWLGLAVFIVLSAIVLFFYVR